MSKVDLANCLGVTPITVGKWVREGCPYVSKGNRGKPWLFNTADVAAWRQDRAVQRAIGDTSALDIDEAKRRKLAAEAAIVELDLAKRRGEVIEVEEIAALVGDEYANVRAKLLSIPVKLAPLVSVSDDALECKDLIERGINEALEELTADGTYEIESAEESVNGTAASESQAAA
jgi:phage terminase Nu1 subunit (DNA packaging protein)